ncbi:hypothetical protein Ancab_001371 [Ancistrocladus abbreviatus]
MEGDESQAIFQSLIQSTTWWMALSVSFITTLLETNGTDRSADLEKHELDGDSPMDEDVLTHYAIFASLKLDNIQSRLERSPLG